jgi:hypothetical protein
LRPFYQMRLCCIWSRSAENYPVVFPSFLTEKFRHSALVWRFLYFKAKKLRSFLSEAANIDFDKFSPHCWQMGGKSQE